MRGKFTLQHHGRGRASMSLSACRYDQPTKVLKPSGKLRNRKCSPRRGISGQGARAREHEETLEKSCSLILQESSRLPPSPLLGRSLSRVSAASPIQAALRPLLHGGLREHPEPTPLTGTCSRFSERSPIPSLMLHLRTWRD